MNFQFELGFITRLSLVQQWFRWVQRSFYIVDATDIRRLHQISVSLERQGQQTVAWVFVEIDDPLLFQTTRFSPYQCENWCLILSNVHELIKHSSALLFRLDSIPCEIHQMHVSDIDLGSQFFLLDYYSVSLLSSLLCFR